MRVSPGFRGRGRSISTTSAIRPGRALITATTSERNTASELPCVTISRDTTGADDVDAAVPGSVELLDERGLIARGLHCAGSGVWEQTAGVIDPDRLRRRLIADIGARANVRIGELSPAADVTVVAAGAWTAQLLTGAGYDASAYRTKAVRYAVFGTGDWRPPSFTDEMTGFYGTPRQDGLLRGRASRDWDVAPGPVGAPDDSELRALAARHLPRLELGATVRTAGAADCYTEPALLDLRHVDGALFTFTGGSGGAAKTALAASRHAADRIASLTSPPSANRSDLL